MCIHLFTQVLSLNKIESQVILNDFYILKENSQKICQARLKGTQLLEY